MASLRPAECRERLPPMSDGSEQAAKPATTPLVQEMPIAPIDREAPRPETLPSPPQLISQLGETLDDKLED